MKHILFLLLFVPVLGWSDNEVDVSEQIAKLESVALRVQQEAQSTYQQFLMIQELRRSEINEMQMPGMLGAPGMSGSTLPSGSVKSIPVPNYDDMVQQKQEMHERIQQYTNDLDRLYARYRELEERRHTIFEEIDLLRQSSEEFPEE